MNNKKLFILILLGLLLIGIFYFAFQDNLIVNKFLDNENNSGSIFDKATDYNNYSCDEIEKEISELLSKANYCDVDSDCTTYHVPIDTTLACYNLVNKYGDLSDIEKLSEQYRSNNCPRSVVSCPAPPEQGDIKCRNNKCVDARIREQ